MQRSGEYNRSAARLDFRNQHPGRVERLFREQGFPYQRVLNFRKAFREQKVDDLLKLKGIQKLDTMIPHLPFNRLRMQRFVEDTWGSKKYRFITEDGHVIESVFMPSKGEDSICISVQAGCRFGCTFCNTGKTGLKRNLLPHSQHRVLAGGRIFSHSKCFPT
jgi:23S rRNA (adenine2503-C2)-methyltransferase